MGDCSRATETITKFSAPSRLCVSFAVWLPVALRRLYCKDFSCPGGRRSPQRGPMESGEHRGHWHTSDESPSHITNSSDDSSTYQDLKLKSAVGVEVSRGAECSGGIMNVFSLFFSMIICGAEKYIFSKKCLKKKEPLGFLGKCIAVLSHVRACDLCQVGPPEL